MIATWRLGLAALCALAVYLLTRRVMELLLLAVRRRIGKRFRWVGDIHHHLLAYLSWIAVLSLFRVIALYILALDGSNDLVKLISYVTIVPLVLATFALRIVAANMIVRHFKWDRAADEYDVKIFVVTEIVKFVCYILILVEVFLVLLSSYEVAGFILLELLIGIGIVVILAGFTMLKNTATGLFLVFAEPFRTGSFCRVLDILGVVEKVSLARTIVRRQDGSLVYIPNGIFADHEQTNSIGDLFIHEVLVILRPSTTMEEMKQARDDLTEALQEYCASLPNDDLITASAIRESLMSSESRPSASRQSRSSMSESSSRAAPRKALQVGIVDRYRFQVRMTINRGLYTTLEAAKTEVRSAIKTLFFFTNATKQVNLSILNVLEHNRIAPFALR